MGGCHCAVAGYSGMETGNARVGRGPHMVAKSGTRVSGEEGGRYTKIREKV